MKNLEETDTIFSEGEAELKEEEKKNNLSSLVITIIKLKTRKVLQNLKFKNVKGKSPVKK